MTLNFEDSRKGDVIPNPNYETTQQEERALMAVNEIKERHGATHTCYCYVDKTKESGSRNGFPDSSIANKWNCCYSRSRGISDQANIARENTTGKIELSSRCFESVQTYGRHDCAGKLKCTNILISVSFVVNIGLIVAVALLSTKIGKTGEIDTKMCPLLQVPKDFIKDSLCLPCNYLGSAVKVEDTLFDVISSCGHVFCCVKNGALQKCFLLMLQEGHGSKGTTESLASENYGGVNMTQSTWCSRNVAAHLYANVTSLPEKLTWQTDAGYGSAFTQNITLTPDSRLQVPYAGFYFIYSLVTFKCQQGSVSRVHMITRQHRVRPNAGVQPLLRSKTSECGPDGIYTSFLAGVQGLKSNDELSVNLTDFSLTSVYKETLSNYFGVYLI
ncbi:hypothetical protein CHS0354_032340 [Potamilus streckersoni]|uniref:THD domain-containing protein n=1 Tax=Potamilus streckersoni TaxID=2493646 RepID=A0AAE0TGK7_9BIVA|nr:hypothetical protein CHS0354_032340 [Potamilus streckersoni]